MPGFSFLTNHSLALLCIANDPEIRLRDIASRLDITERSAYTIVTDLTSAGYLSKRRDGRRNSYEIQAHLPLPDTIGSELTIGDVLDLFVQPTGR
jgi:Winged helix DNA-binding domain